jgi:succinyl-CoA synthetase alpha subunit
MVVLEEAKKKRAVIIGPNTPGMISPPENAKLGFVPNMYFQSGPVGVASRSGTLTYELVSRLTAVGLGQSTVIGVGGDRIVGLRFRNALSLFEKDPNTKAVLLIGEIGGAMEEEAGELIVRGEIRKPVFAYIAGCTAPEGQRIGHAGAIISESGGTVESKIKMLQQSGVQVGQTIAEVIELMKKALGN